MVRKNIIWNINKGCAFDCAICCTDSYHISSKDSQIFVKINSLKETLKFKRNKTKKLFDDANDNLRKKGLEIDIKEKLKILNNIDIPCKIDFSGGDPLLLEENLKIITSASEKFGKENISITSTGIGLSLVSPHYLKETIGHIDFTYDYSGNGNIKNRPNTYNSSNLKKIKSLIKLGIKTTTQTPLSKENNSISSIKNIYLDLKKSGVEDILLMKFLPVGRGSNLKSQQLTKEECKNTINEYKKLESKYKKPIIRIQSILNKRKNNWKDFKKKYLISNSININHKGLLLLSPWAYDEKGEPLKEFIAGDLKKNKLSKIYPKKLHSFINETIQKNK